MKSFKAVWLLLLLNLCLISNGQQKIDAITYVSPNETYQANDNIKATGFIMPGLMIGYGSLKGAINKINTIDVTTRNSIYKYYPYVRLNIADYLMWVPSASIYAMDALKIKTRHTFKEHLLIDAGSIVVTGGLGFIMREATKHNTVYNKYETQFPSGHTANAFRGAEVVHQELKSQNKLLSYSGYVIATGVGLCRLYGKDHLLTEVIAGAGLGILSTKITYLLFNKYRNHSSDGATGAYQ